MPSRTRPAARPRRPHAPGRRGLTRTAASIAVVGIAGLGAIYFFSWAQLVIIPFAVATVTGLTLSPVAFRLERHMPPAFSALVLLLAIFALAAGLFAALAIPAQYWSSRLPEVQFALRDRLYSLQGPFETLSKIGKTVEEAKEA
ncbi:MAG: hypothetical protein AB7G34_14345, partial [Hyphomicrobiales bacterium]